MDDQSGVGGTAERKQPTVRSKWTAQQRQQIVEVSDAAGASLEEVAQRHGMRVNLLKVWRRRHAAQSAALKSPMGAARFSAVAVPAISDEGVIEIDLSSGCVRVRGIVNAAMLREVLAAAR